MPWLVLHRRVSLLSSSSFVSGGPFVYLADTLLVALIVMAWLNSVCFLFFIFCYCCFVAVSGEFQFLGVICMDFFRWSAVVLGLGLPVL